ncbi:MAG TPA: MFS transporter [Chloroflexota bacterium]
MAAEEARPASQGEARPEGTRDAPRRFGALAHRDFTLLWAGLLVSNAGTWMQTVAQGWVIYNLTDDRLALGAMGLAFGLPMVLFPLFGGVVADRIDRLTLLKATQTAALLLAVLLAALTWLGVVQFWHFWAIAFASATVLAFDNPARQALIPDLVPREDLMSAISLNSVSFTGAQLVGPALAGLILAAFGRDLLAAGALVFLVNALSYLAVLVPLFFIRPRHAPPRAPGAEPDSRGNALVDGLRYVRSQPVLLLLIGTVAVTSVFGRSFTLLLPIFARDVLDVGGEGLGWLNAAAGLGTIAAGLALAGLGQGLSRRALIVGGIVALTASIYGFALSARYLPSLALLALSGAAGTAMAASVATQIQSTVPGRLRGRVMSLNTLGLIGLGPLGAFVSASMARVLPIQVAIAATASVMLLYLIATLLVGPIRRVWAAIP